MEGEYGYHGEFIPTNTDCETPCPRGFRNGEGYRDTHHPYFPEADYDSRIDNKFRNLGENLIRLCRCKHIQIHDEQESPEKPCAEYMIWRIRESDEHVSVRLRKEMEQYE